jgi:hypothetical protein
VKPRTDPIPGARERVPPGGLVSPERLRLGARKGQP